MPAIRPDQHFIFVFVEARDEVDAPQEDRAERQMPLPAGSG